MMSAVLQLTDKCSHDMLEFAQIMIPSSVVFQDRGDSRIQQVNTANGHEPSLSSLGRSAGSVQ
jgi:hypothetical protein